MVIDPNYVYDTVWRYELLCKFLQKTNAAVVIYLNYVYNTVSRQGLLYKLLRIIPDKKIPQLLNNILSIGETLT